MSRLLIVGMAWAGCTACASVQDVDWRRALYEGQRNGAAQCRLNPRPAEPPCPSLPDAAAYERERANASGRTGTPADPDGR